MLRRSSKREIANIKSSVITFEIFSRIWNYVFNPRVLWFLLDVFIGFICSLALLTYIGVIQDRNLLWRCLAVCTAGYSLIHLILGIREAKTIRRVFSLSVLNRPRLPFIVLSIGITSIIAIQLAKAGTDDKTVQSLYDGATGVTASLVAAALYQILEIWRELREKRDSRRQLLLLLGIDELTFNQNKDSIIKIILPGFPFEKNEDETDAYTGDVAKQLGARNKLGHGIKKLCAAEDVEAFRVITQMFQDREIQWELAYPEEVLGIDPQTATFDSIKTLVENSMDSLPGYYVSIGLYSNIFTMLSNFVELKNFETGLAYVVPFDQGGDPRIQIRDMALNNPKTNSSSAVHDQSERNVSGDVPENNNSVASDKIRFAFDRSNVASDKSNVASESCREKWRDHQAEWNNSIVEVDSCLIFRRPLSKGSILILGGLSALGTKSCALYFQENWNQLNDRVEKQCKNLGVFSRTSKFAHVFSADMSQNPSLPRISDMGVEDFILRVN